MAEENTYTKEQLQNNYTQPAAGSNNAFETGHILYAADIKELATAVEGSANAQKVADKLNQLETSLESKIEEVENGLEEEITNLQTETEEEIERIDRDISERGVGLYFNEQQKTLHMVYGDGSTSEEGITVATDLTGYATEQHVENRLNIGANKTVKKYVDDKFAQVDVSTQLTNYYTKPQVDSIGLEAEEVGDSVYLTLIGANGSRKQVDFAKATSSEYYRIRSVTADSFGTIPGNDKTPQKIQYKAGHMRGESGWGNELYYEKWVIQNNNVTTHTITRSKSFIDITKDNYHEFDFAQYLGDGETAINLYIYTSNDYSGDSRDSYTWYATKIEFDLVAEFPAPRKCGENSTIACTLPSGTDKRLTLLLDGVPYDEVLVQSNTLSHNFVLTSNTHGAKRAEVRMEATIDDQVIPAIPETGTLIWYNETDPTPILAMPQTSYEAKRYDGVLVSYHPFAWVNGSSSNTLNLKVYSDENGEQELLSDENIDSNVLSNWEYPTETVKDNIQLTFVLSNEYGSTSTTVAMKVIPGDYNFEPVAGENFALIPRKYSNNAFSNNCLNLTEWVKLELSNNFNLSAGGFGKSAGTYYFKIPAYNRIRISGKSLFNENQDSHFKLVFKTENARYNDVVFLQTGEVDEDGDFVASSNGVKLTTNHGYVQGNEAIKAISVFTTEEIIDYAFNIVNPTRHGNKTYTAANNGKIPKGYREGDYKDLTLEKYMIMPYEDGVASLPKVYSDATLADLFEDAGSVIEIGSDDCDVYIYSLRSYDQALGIDDVCTNFVADGPTLNERRLRFDRNNWNVLTNNILKNPKLASELMPEVKIVLITAPYFTNDKKDEVEETYIQVLQNAVYEETDEGRTKVDNKPYNWITKGGMHCGQGTSSNAYGFSGRNLTLKLGSEVYEGAGTVFNGKNEQDFSEYAANLTPVSSNKVAIGPGSIPVNQFNIKVNIASSENQNNALMANLYDKLMSQVYKRPAKFVDPRVKDTMEFDNCLVYIRETSQVKNNRREFLVEDEDSWHFYALGNFGDHKKTDSTRLDNIWDNTNKKWVSDPLETIVEIMDYDVPLCGFNPKDDLCGVKPYVEGADDYSEGGYRPSYLKFDDLLNYKTTFDDGKGAGPETHYGVYEWDDEDKKYACEGFGAINAAVLTEQEDGSKLYEEDLKISYEFRYEMKKLTNTQRDTNIENWNTFYRAIAPIYFDLKNGTISPRQAKEKIDEFMIADSAILFYLFTERFSLIDNRAKNSFWHYSKKYYTETEASNMPADLQTKLKNAKIIDNSRAAINNGYRWDLCFGYDFDTCLGIDNVGKLAFEYGQETTDKIFRTKSPIIKNGLEANTEGFNYFFEIFNDLGYEMLSDIYNKNTKVINLFGSSGEEGTMLTWDNAQKQFPEKVWLRDYERKYIRTSGDFQVDGSITTQSGEEYNKDVRDSKEKKDDYLTDKANGLKRYHRRDFEKKQSMYMQSRWLKTTSDYVYFRFDTSPSQIQVGFTQKCYYSTTTEISASQWSKPNANWTKNADGTYTYSKGIQTGGEAILIYPASQISSLKFPETYSSEETTMKMAGSVDINKAKKLVEFSMGTTDQSRPRVGISTTTFDNCKMLEKINLTNCLGNEGSFGLYLTNNIGFRELLAENSDLVEVRFAPNGMLERAQLEKIQKLSLVNTSQLSTLSIKDTSSLTSLRLENCPTAVKTYDLIMDTKDTLTELRLVGINWPIEVGGLNLRNYNLFDELALKKGISDRGETIELTDTLHHGAVIAGTAHVNETSTRIETRYKKFWPDMTFTYNIFVSELPIYFHAKEEELWSEGDTPLDEQWLVIGASPTDLPVDPITKGKVPTKEQTLTEVYAFKTWSDTDIFKYGISEPTNVWPIFEPSPRLYTVKWAGVNNEVAYEQNVTYGEGAEYDYTNLGYPEKDPVGTTYHLFSGWDGYQYSIKEDGVIFKPVFTQAVPSASNPSDGVLPSLAQLNAICGYGSQNNSVDEEETADGFEYSVYEQKSLGLGEKISTIIGWDPDDDLYCPDDRKPVFDLLASNCKAYKAFSKNATATQFTPDNPIATIDSPLLLNHVDSSFKYVDTGITLFDEGDEEFTIILDYRFLDTEINSGNFSTGTTKTVQKLLSCSYEDSKSTSYKDLKVGRESGTNPFYVYSDTKKQRINRSMEVAASAGVTMTTQINNEAARRAPTEANVPSWSLSHADRVVIRKKKGSNQLEIFPSYSWWTKSELEEADTDGIHEYFGDKGVRRFTMDISGIKNHKGTVTLGAARKYTTTQAVDTNTLCNASISGLKIWKIALSDAEITRAANYPKEKLTFWVTAYPRADAYKTGKGYYSLTNEDAVADNRFPGVVLELRDFLKNTRYYEGTIKEEKEQPDGSIKTVYRTPSNMEGWTKIATREWLNTRVFYAMPEEWRAAIKPVKIFQLIGTPIKDAAGNNLLSGDYKVDSSNFDRLFNLSYQEIVTNTLAERYGEEAAPASIAYDNETRRKFFEVGGKWYNGFNRTRTPITTTTGYWRIEPAGGVGQGSSKNYKAWVTFAFCI